jgi:acetyltransferase-like isoleucine patch superfamily enzyme
VPVDRSHAFAGGRAYARPSPIARLLRPGLARAWRSFDRGADVGAGCRLGPNAWCVNSGPGERIRLGERVVCRGIVRCEEFGDGRIDIGDDVYIGDDCIVSCADRVSIGAGVLLGHGVQIFDNNSHPTDVSARIADWRAITDGGQRGEIRAAPVAIGPGAWIGFGAFVLKGVTIGAEAIVGAGSVVTRDVPPSAIVAGNPAEQVTR